jgi:predicted O-methyltransferase YrrM
MMEVFRFNLTKPIIITIEELVKDIPGWSPIDQLYSLYLLSLMSSNLEGDILELGTWCGRSAAVLSLSSEITGDVNVYCVDLFPEKKDWFENEDGSYSFKVKIGKEEHGAYQIQTVWKEPFERDIKPLYEKYNGVFDIFSEKLKERNLWDKIKPFKGTLDMFVSSVPNSFKCRLAFIDGDHSYEAVCKDIKNIEKYLVPGGIICFDDAFSSYEGVNRAIQDCIIDNDKYDLKQQMTRKFFVARRRG